MRVLLTGPSGLIAQRLMKEYGEGIDFVPLSRSNSGNIKGALRWNAERNIFPSLDELGKIDAVCHLAGENIASGRWNEHRKEKILKSRTLGTSFLVENCLKLDPLPRSFISASAVGYYNKREENEVDEESPPGRGFLAEVCQAWEKSSEALPSTCRRVFLRFAMVLSQDGGALAKMLPLFKAGLGGPLGDGKQLVSWISLGDAVSAIRFVLEHERIQGPVNISSPNPVSNEEFTKILAKILHRPAFFRVPTQVLKLALGEMAQELLLSSTAALPRKLSSESFKFQSEELEDALRRELA